jgi:tetratricopeptide (TPR) repeat protein
MVRTLGEAAILMALVVAVYWGTLSHGFIWDDDLHVYTNPRIIGPQGIWEIWTTAAANYFPLVLTNFWAQHALWGLAPAGYHAVTIACHALGAVLLWRVLLALRVPGAWLGAALWALHPVQVESVAWISELKNTQSGIFFLLSILFFVRWLDSGPGAGPGKLYAGALLAALLALLSKPSTVTLPVVLALIAWWRHGTVRVRDLLPLAPFFLLSAIASGWTIWEQRVHSGAEGAEWNQGLLDRVTIAGKTAWFYLGKLLWPHPLVFIYPRWVTTARALDFVPALLALATCAVLAWRRIAWRAGFVAAVCFVALLFPVLGFFDVYFFRYSFVGDHFQYLASMAPLALAASWLARWPRKIGIASAGVLLGILAVLSARQSRIYADNVTLWQATVTANPDAHMAWMNLADSLSKAGRHTEAIDTFHRANALRADDPDGHSDLGCELVLVGRPAEALPEFETALRLRDSSDTHNNLGNALWYLGRHQEALVEYRHAVELKPDSGDAQNNLASSLAQLGQTAEALPHFAVALRVNPLHVEAHDNLGNALRALGRLPEAIAQHQRAVQLRPGFAEAENNLALDFEASGRAEEAIAHFERALALRPDFVAAAGGLAKLLSSVGRADEARRRLETAVRLAPNSAAARNNLGSFFAENGRPADAIAEFEQTVRLDPNWVRARMNLGGAFAAAQRWLDAAKQFEAAAKLQPDSVEAFASLGVALVNADRLEAGARSFVRALQLNPKSAGLHEQLAQVLRALGRDREAQQHLDEAARLRRE